jgi:hypothetical protein
MNASLNVLANSEQKPRRLVLDSKDINAISSFAQKRMRLPQKFLLERAKKLKISDDARAIIYILLGYELMAAVSEEDRAAMADIADNFRVWASAAVTEPAESEE